MERDKTSDGIRARTFTLQRDSDAVPVIVWAPADATDPLPKVLLGHGGTQDKEAPNIVALAHALVRRGMAAVAIDAPGHGARVTEAQRAAFRERVRRTDPTVPRDRGDPNGTYSKLFSRGVADWRAVLDEVERWPDIGASATGWWGVSMGTSIGLPFVATEPRISAAVLGLASTVSRPGHDDYLGWARSLAVPLLFLCQRDDGGHPIENALELFDLFGSPEKTMHLNPGPHVGVPGFERDAAVRFFVRHLLAT